MEERSKFLKGGGEKTRFVTLSISIPATPDPPRLRTNSFLESFQVVLERFLVREILIAYK